MTKIVEYIWLDYDSELRSKIRVVDYPIETIDDIEIWNYDGSSTGQAQLNNSEVILKPVFLCNNPFHDGFLVMCETFVSDSNLIVKPHVTNKRFGTNSKINQLDQPWFGIEQEYYILDQNTNIPHGYDIEELQQLQTKKFYCGSNIKQVKGREIAEEHMYHCIAAGLTVAGINQESGPGQWEYQIGPITGIQAADELWISRFILLRIAAKRGVMISFDPKPLGDEFPGSGCHINFSNIKSRGENGYEHILEQIKKLEISHYEFVNICSINNKKRLTGQHNSSFLQNFSSGVGSRNTSIRIPRDTKAKGYGYYEDRRPNADIDPYAILGFYV